MSQVCFNCECKGKRAKVQAGWDRPLRYYHLTVFNLDIPEDDYETEECIYSDLNDPDCFSRKTTEALRAILAGLDIEPPEGFWQRCEMQLGNVFFDYVNGEWRQS